jgi:hypothetical protein
LLDQLPLLNAFFNGAPKTAIVTAAAGQEFLVDTLGSIYATVKSYGFRRYISQKMIRLGSRRSRLKSKVKQEITKVLKVCAPTVIKELKKAIQLSAKQTKREVKGTGGKRNLIQVSEKRLKIQTQFPSAKFANLNTELNRVTTKMTEPQLNGLRSKQADRVSKKYVDEAHSKGVLNIMVNPDGISPASPSAPAGAPSNLTALELETKEALSNIVELPGQSASPAPAPTSGPTFPMNENIFTQAQVATGESVPVYVTA